MLGGPAGNQPPRVPALDMCLARTTECRVWHEYSPDGALKTAMNPDASAVRVAASWTRLLPAFVRVSVMINGIPRASTMGSLC